MISSRYGSVAGATVASAFLLAFVVGAAAPASAAPPSYRYQNREASSGASLSSYAETSDGYRFAFVGASQFFDRAGTYEGAEVYFYQETVGPNSLEFKDAACQVDRSALAIFKTDATVAAVVDTDNCFFNIGCSVDFATGEWTCGNGFSGTLEVAGSWRDAAATDSSQSNGRYASPSETFNYTCRFRAGNSHAHAEVLINGESLGPTERSNVFRNDCNVLSKVK
jgi:hypothetical protein